MEQLEREVERAGSSRGGGGAAAAAGAGAGLVGDAAAVAALAKYNKLKERYKVGPYRVVRQYIVTCEAVQDSEAVPAAFL